MIPESGWMKNLRKNIKQEMSSIGKTGITQSLLFREMVTWCKAFRTQYKWVTGALSIWKLLFTYCQQDEIVYTLLFKRLGLVRSKTTEKTTVVKHYIIFNSYLLYACILTCNLLLWCQSWIFSIYYFVFSITWSFRNHHNILIWCSRDISYYQCCKNAFTWNTNLLLTM